MMPTFLQEALTEIDEQRAKVESWRPTADAAERAVVAAGDALAWRLSVGYGVGSLNGILIVASDVVDLKHAVPLLRALRKEGFRVERHQDWEEIPSRTYYLQYVGDTPPSNAPLIVRVVFPWDPEKAASAACRFVQTGTKEVPVMEIVCGGEKTPELDAAEVSA
jgi:hypothetical protein